MVDRGEQSSEPLQCLSVSRNSNRTFRNIHKCNVNQATCIGVSGIRRHQNNGSMGIPAASSTLIGCVVRALHDYSRSLRQQKIAGNRAGHQRSRILFLDVEPTDSIEIQSFPWMLWYQVNPRGRKGFGSLANGFLCRFAKRFPLVNPQPQPNRS